MSSNKPNISTVIQGICVVGCFLVMLRPLAAIQHRGVIRSAAIPHRGLQTSWLHQQLPAACQRSAMHQCLRAPQLPPPPGPSHPVSGPNVPLWVAASTLLAPCLLAACRFLRRAWPPPRVAVDTALQSMAALDAGQGDQVVVEDEPNTFRIILSGNGVVYEKDEDGVVMLSYGPGSELWMGFYNPGNPLDFGLQYFKSQVAVMLCTGPHHRVLMLGLGIGALPITLQMLYPEVDIDVVEIDAVVIEGTTRYLPLQMNGRLNVHHADAAEFVQRKDREGCYDFVMLDCFDASGIPMVFHSKSFYQDALRCLKPGGIFSANLIWTLPEVQGIRQHLGSLLKDPSILFCPGSTNCIVFGLTTHDGSEALSQPALAAAAKEWDEKLVLPYSLSDQISHVEKM